MRALSGGLLALTLALGPAACSSSSSSSEGTAPIPVSRDTRVLTPAEIDAGIAQSVTNAYDLVMRQRSNWTRSTTVGVRGEQATPTVWMDNQKLGGIQQLRNIPLTAIAQMRYLTASEAQGLLGLDNMGGAIVVTRR